MAKQATKKAWPCTADDVVRERDTKGLSWRQVAINLDLGSPGQARKAYTELTGTHHSESQPKLKRAKRGSGAGKKKESPGWDDDSDQEAIEARLQGEWVEDSGGGSDYVPAHWEGSLITVQHKIYGSVFEEDIYVSQVTAFTYGPEGDQPLQVCIHERGTGAFRTVRVADIKSVS